MPYYIIREGYANRPDIWNYKRKKWQWFADSNGQEYSSYKSAHEAAVRLRKTDPTYVRTWIYDVRQFWKEFA